MYERPADLFDRDHEWRSLTHLVEQDRPGLRIGVVHGRRRQGKSFLLRRLSSVANGLYHQAQELERSQALARFAGDVAHRLGLPREQLHFGDWETALRTALGYPRRGGEGAGGGRGAERPAAPTGERRLLVLDELPYLLRHSPEIPSVLQELYDEGRDGEGDYPAAVVVVCGSALSVMKDLLSGTQPLRGRAELDLVLTGFDFRIAARYWGIEDPELALTVHTIFGGTAGYRSLVRTPVPTDAGGLVAWLGDNVLNPAHALFGEKDYLLREDTRIADKQLYNSILSAVAAGNRSPSGIAAVLGRPATSLAHPLGVLLDTGFLLKVEDVLSQRKPTYVLADPIIRFSEVVLDPHRPELEEGKYAEVWRQAMPGYRSQILGPHFEELARTWTRRFSGDRWGVRLGEVGPAAINDPSGRTQHELDVVGLARGHRRADRNARVVVLGEAKAGEQPRGVGDLDRLDRVRELLLARGWDAAGARLALFSRSGFTDEVIGAADERPDVHLITWQQMYDDNGSPPDVGRFAD